MSLAIHPLAEIFPAMSDVEFQALKADIDAHGQHEVIWTYKGQIIDGRHRYRAMTELGMDPHIREYEFSDVLAFVLSMNLHRRHLDTPQRAMVAEKLANMRQGERTDIEPSANLPKVSQSDAAAMVNVSTRAVTEASKITKTDPELAQVVAAGGVSLHAASKVASLPKEQRKAAVAGGADAINEAAKAVKAPAPKKSAPPAAPPPDKAADQALIEELREIISNLEDANHALTELNKDIEQENRALLTAVDPEVHALVQKTQAYAKQLEERRDGLMASEAKLMSELKKTERKNDRLQKELTALKQGGGNG